MVSGVLAFRDGTRHWIPMAVLPHPNTVDMIRKELSKPPACSVELFWIDDITSTYAQGILQARGFSQ